MLLAALALLATAACAGETVERVDSFAVTAGVQGGLALLDWTRSPGITFDITVPPDTLLDVSTSNGGVDVTGIRQPARLKGSNGTIEVTDFDGDLVAETSNGSVSTDFPILTRSTGSGNRLEGTIGDGESTLVIRTSNGRISIERPR